MFAHNLLNEKYETYGQFVGFKNFTELGLLYAEPSKNVNNTADNSL